MQTCAELAGVAKRVPRLRQQTSRMAVSFVAYRANRRQTSKAIAEK